MRTQPGQYPPFAGQRRLNFRSFHLTAQHQIKRLASPVTSLALRRDMDSGQDGYPCLYRRGWRAACPPRSTAFFDGFDVFELGHGNSCSLICYREPAATARPQASTLRVLSCAMGLCHKSSVFMYNFRMNWDRLFSATQLRFMAPRVYPPSKPAPALQIRGLQSCSIRSMERWFVNVNLYPIRACSKTAQEHPRKLCQDTTRCSKPPLVRGARSPSAVTEARQ